MRDLWYAEGTSHIRFHWLALTAMTLVGAGMIADLAVAVSSAVEEVHRAKPSCTSRELFRSGMRFGRDVLCTELNTLPLAVLGTAMGGLLLVLAVPDVAHRPYNWLVLANKQSTALELAALVGGTIGLVLTIPLTAWLTSRAWGIPDSEAGPSIPAARRDGPGRWLARWVPLATLVALAAVAFIWLGRSEYHYPSNGNRGGVYLTRGRVDSVCPEVSPWAPAAARPNSEALQTLKVQTASGEVLTVENSLTGSPVSDRLPATGGRVIVQVHETAGGRRALLGEIERDRMLLLLLAFTCAVVVVVAGAQGWRALAALTVDLGLIAIFLLAVARWRAPPVIATLGCVLVVTMATYLVICGWSRKGVSASVGALVGMAVSGAVALGFSAWLGLSGRFNEELSTLFHYSAGRAIDFRSLLVAAALLGALGAVMDVAIAVSSAVTEVRRAAPQSGFRALLASGLAVGRRVMAAMFGAVLFAYLGLNLGLFVLPWVQAGSFTQALPTERMATEVFRLLIAGLAIVWTIPAAALLAAWLGSRGAAEPWLAAEPRTAAGRDAEKGTHP